MTAIERVKAAIAGLDELAGLMDLPWECVNYDGQLLGEDGGVETRLYVVDVDDDLIGIVIDDAEPPPYWLVVDVKPTIVTRTEWVVVDD